DLILPVIERHVAESRPVQWVVLGSGDPRIENQLHRLTEIAPRQVSAHIGFHEGLAHRIEAASDLFVMPSHYEPCGLNQLYSLSYGTVPVVNATGGLADTVIRTDPETIAKGTATGFHLREISPQGLDDTIGAALHMRYHDRKNWEKLVERGMRQDWSWRKSASRYVELYEDALSLTSTNVE
ncbi:MAG: glycosyltransferase, partial [Planctomycetota bacterium]